MMITLFTLLLACGDKAADDSGLADQPSANDTSGTDTDTDTTTDAPDFVGREFVFASAQGYQPVAETLSVSFPSMEGELITLQFSGSCNGMGGSFRYEEGIVNMQDFMMTEMACEDSALMDEDTWFGDFWTSGPSLALEGDVLTISDDTNTFTFRDAELVIPDAPLKDTRWLFDTFLDGETASSFNITSIPWVEFRSDDSFAIYTGCVSGLGTYTVAGTTISVTVDNYADGFCPDDISQTVEGYMSSVFLSDVEYTIEGPRITLQGETKGISGLAE